jgi:hypothetical protein
MDLDRELARHFLAVFADRTQKALRDAPVRDPDLEAGYRARTPVQRMPARPDELWPEWPA